MPNKKDTIKIINDFLSDDNTTKRVLVLKGSWGTGKTWLWKNEIIDQPQYSNKKIGYVSLFGKSSIQDINKAALSAVYLANKASKITSKFKKITSALDNATENFAKLNTAVQGIDALLSVINRENLENTIICFDDLERMDKNIDFQDFLGFVNDLAEHHECKVVLIFNEDELFKKQDDETSKNKENNKNTSNNTENKNAEQDETTKENIYNKFKEKTIDIEVTYTPTFEENFKIVTEYFKDIETEYLNSVRDVFEYIKENNIRILFKSLENVSEFINTVDSIRNNIKHFNDFKAHILNKMIQAITYYTQQYVKYGHQFWLRDESDKLSLEIMMGGDDIYTSKQGTIAFLYYGSYEELVGDYFQGINYINNPKLIKSFSNIDNEILYNKLKANMNNIAHDFWHNIDYTKNDYINNMCNLFNDEDNAFCFFINEDNDTLNIAKNNDLLKDNTIFKELFYNQMNKIIDKFINDSNFNIQENYHIISKVRLISPSKVHLLYKKPSNADEYYNLLINIFSKKYLESSKYLLEQLDYEKYKELCNENSDFFIDSKLLFFDRKKYFLQSQIPHFLYITAKYLLETIEINPDNEIKYDVFGKSRIGNNDNNYSAKRDLEEYIALYESNHPESK